MVLVGKAFKETSIGKAKHIKLDDLTNFNQIIVEFVGNKEQLKTIFDSEKENILTSKNLSDLKLSIVKSENKFLSFFKTIGIFQLAMIERDMFFRNKSNEFYREIVLKAKGIERNKR